MTEQELAKIKDKIRKLIALASSPVEAEAKLAMEKAGELMAKYELSIAEVRESEGHDIKDMVEDVFVNGVGDRRRNWEAMLGHAISQAFDAEIILSSGGQIDSWGVHFIGHKSDVELVVFFHKHLRRHVWGMARMNYKTKHDRESYCFGAVETLRKRLNDMYKRKQEVMDESCTALVVVKKGAVSEKVKELYPNLRKSSIGQRSTNWRAFDSGKKDGEKINLNRPVGGSEQTAQIG